MDVVVVAKTRDNRTVRDIKVTRPTVNVAVDTMIKATARPMISTVVHVVNEDTSGSPRSVPAIVTTTHNVKAMIQDFRQGNNRGYGRGRGGYRNRQVHSAAPDDDYYDEYPLQEQFDNLQVDDVFHFDTCNEQSDDNMYDEQCNTDMFDNANPDDVQSDNAHDDNVYDDNVYDDNVYDEQRNVDCHNVSDNE